MIDPLLHSHLNQIKQQTAAHTEHLQNVKEHHSDSLKAIQQDLENTYWFLKRVLVLQVVGILLSLLTFFIHR
jgi:hypothetical protein